MDKLFDIEELHAKHTRQQNTYIVSGILFFILLVVPATYFIINKKASKHNYTNSPSSSYNEVGETNTAPDTNPNPNSTNDNSVTYQPSYSSDIKKPSRISSTYNDNSYNDSKILKPIFFK
jgi:hypothetical protein